jgi:hypothetical protein
MWDVAGIARMFRYKDIQVMCEKHRAIKNAFKIAYGIRHTAYGIRYIVRR